MLGAIRLIFVSLLVTVAIFCSGCLAEAPQLEALGTIARVDPPLVVTPSVKRCQLTGFVDRGSNALSGRRTGVMLGGGSASGANATDIGWAFQDFARGQLNFLFGDTHQFPIDRCEPFVCGAVGSEIHPPPGEGTLERWQSEAEWDDFQTHNGDGQENMATAPISGFDPDNCIPLTVRTDERGEAFDHTINLVSHGVAAARRVPAPKIGTRPEDRWVVTLGTSILVITSDGWVFRHSVALGTSVNQIDVAHRIGWVPVNANDKAALVLGDHIVMVRGTGHVDAYPVGVNVGLGRRLDPMPGQAQPLVAVTPDARQLFANPLTNQLLVGNAAGQVFFHNIDLTNYQIEVPYQLAGHPGPLTGRLAIVADGNGARLVNVLPNGTVAFYVINSTAIGPAIPGSGVPVASRPVDRWVVALGNHLLVLTEEQVFHPTRLNGHPLGRREGAFSGFADGPTSYAFFTRRHWQPGCPPDKVGGCMHDDEGGPSKTVLARSLDGSNDFDEITSISTSMFLFVAPDVVGRPPASWNLPAGFGGNTVVMFGSGRVGNPVAKWGNSYPYLAVAPLRGIWQRTSQVHVHPVTSSSIGGQSQLSTPSYGVAANPQDRWVIGRKDQILVIDATGAVHAHPVGTSSVGVHTTLPASAPVGTSPMDRWVLAKGTDHLVIVRYDGLVYIQPVGTSVGNAYQLGPANGAFLPLIGHTPEHKWATLLRNSILVLTRDGRLLRYTINTNNTGLHPEWELGNRMFAPPIVDSIERFLAVGMSLYAITTKGTVYSARATVDAQGSVASVGSPTVINANGPFVAGNAADRWVLSVGDPNQSTGRVAVIPYFPKSGVWRYYAGRNAQGAPKWSSSESSAVPLPPFGAERGDPEFHRRLGYFSARYMPAVGKWLMLYNIGDDPPGQPHGNQRAVYLRTASFPMGPWSAPTKVWSPDQFGYCYFMFSRCPCPAGTLNPYEGAQRDRDPPDDLDCLPSPASSARATRSWGGEYAPLLLPASYFKSLGGGAYRLYYSISTWNPYQSVLMSTDVSGF